MVRTAIIGEDDPVELLEGWIVKKMTKSPRHRLATRLLRDALQRHIPQGWDVDSQDPVTLSASEPEPDATIVRGGPRDYADRHPGAGDVALVAEVSDSSLAPIGASRRQFTPPPALPFIGSSTCWRGGSRSIRIRSVRAPARTTRRVRASASRTVFPWSSMDSRLLRFRLARFCRRDPSDGWFCPNLLEIRCAKSPVRSFRRVVLPELARNPFCQVPFDPDQFPTENSGPGGTRGPRRTRERLRLSGNHRGNRM